MEVVRILLLTTRASDAKPSHWRNFRQRPCTQEETRSVANPIPSSPVISPSCSRFRPNQCHFHHLQFDAWDWVGFHTSQFTFADPQMDRVFATPSVILRSAGSVGMALIMWLLGAAVAATGSAVYLEYGTVSVLSSSRVIVY